ncbi:MAG: hypothetical protein KAI59_03610, partial [Planctomycetes bacterium]|nr:hypothetical protein [Planctomycetota bacterium]
FTDFADFFCLPVVALAKTGHCEAVLLPRQSHFVTSIAAERSVKTGFPSGLSVSLRVSIPLRSSRNDKKYVQTTCTCPSFCILGINYLPFLTGFLASSFKAIIR